MAKISPWALFSPDCFPAPSFSGGLRLLHGGKKSARQDFDVNRPIIISNSLQTGKITQYRRERHENSQRLPAGTDDRRWPQKCNKNLRKEQILFERKGEKSLDL
jgi:hypothetical protein